MNLFTTFNQMVCIRTAGFLALILTALVACTASPERYNVVLVITDDQGYGDLAVHGNPYLKTPNLDRLHAKSIRFTNFHVDPTCAPTRAALMTGHYSLRTGVWHTLMGRSFLRRDEKTMAEVFADSSYRTAIFGKWALGGNYPFRPQDRGFQEVFMSGDGGSTFVGDYWGNDRFDDTFFHNGKPEATTGFCTDVLFDRAMSFIESNRNQPFFVYLTTNTAHGPFNIPEEYENLYRDMPGVPNPAFYGTITKIDENIGRLRRRLRELDLEKRTIFIFMTDNGTVAGVQGTKGFNAGMREQKSSIYDGGHRVPLFMHLPKEIGSVPKDIDRLTAHIDILPTLIELCDLEAPKSVQLDGRSLVPLWRNGEADWPARTLVVDSQRIPHPKKWRYCAVMTDRWRLINGRELYDMRTNPAQTTSVADQHPKVVETLRGDYEAWWSSVSSRFDEYCRIVIGSEAGNIFPLTSVDWHAPMPKVLWTETQILGQRQGNGFWPVQIERDGLYQFALRRWPAEVDAPIRAAIPGGKAYDIVQARLKIGQKDETQPVPDGAVAATFRIRLHRGKTRLQTWFTDPDGTSRGAYYVYVKRLGD